MIKKIFELTEDSKLRKDCLNVVAVKCMESEKYIEKQEKFTDIYAVMLYENYASSIKDT